MALWAPSVCAVPIGLDPLTAWRTGLASGHSAYLFGDLDYSYSDSQGALFVGGNARLQDFRVGDDAPVDLVVKGTLDFQRGYVTGNLRNDAPLLDGVGMGGSLLPSGIDDADVATALAYYQSLSAFWADGDPVGSLSQTPWGAFSLTTVPGINVFTLNESAAPLVPYNRFDIFLDEDATVIINVRGDGLALHNLGFHLNGQLVDEYQDPGAGLSQRIFFNFPDARELILGCIAPDGTCGDIGLPGHVLAPWADITAINGQLIGELVANGLSDGGWSTDYGRFQLNSIPDSIPVPLPPTTALLLAGALVWPLLAVRRRG